VPFVTEAALAVAVSKVVKVASREEKDSKEAKDRSVAKVRSDQEWTWMSL